MDCSGRSRYPSRLSRTRLSVATLLCCAVALVDGVVTCANAAPAQHGGVESGSAGGRSLLDAQSSAMTVTVRDDGTLMLSDAPEDAKRPFKAAFYYNFDPVEPLEIVEYLRDTVMPTVASLLGRWIRVRIDICSCSVHFFVIYICSCSESSATNFPACTLDCG